MPTKDVISVFGLGKLGCTMLACFAHKGWKVIGMDVLASSVKKINNAESPIYEPGVDAMIKANKERITATTDPVKAVNESTISFIIVPTPSQEDGSFTTVYVNEVVAEIGSILRAKKDFHTIVVTSTVLPGDMAHIKEFLEKTSGKKCGKDFGLCYNPDFIALGSIIKNFLNPDMILIGESDKRAGEHLHSIHEALVDNKPTIHRMNFHNAELTKIALNSYCTLKITFANTIAEICEHLPGGDADVVTKALGADTRVGQKYIKGGLSYGGPCFPRDNRAIAYSAKKFGCQTPLAEMTDKLNDYHRKERIPNVILGILKKKNVKSIAVLGLTYKADTTLVEESAAIHVVRALCAAGIKVKAYDPAGVPAAQKEKGLESVKYCASSEECLKNEKVVFIASPWPEFKKLSKADFIKHMGTAPVVYDGWSMLGLKTDSELEYLEIGKAF